MNKRIEHRKKVFDELHQIERPKYADARDHIWLYAEKKDISKYYNSFRGIEDIADWMGDALKHDRGGYLSEELRKPLVDKSWSFDRQIITDTKLDIDRVAYNRHIGNWNADDYLLANAYPLPERMQPKRLLDFGAGYGRQVNLWHQMVPDLQYVALDAIRKSYLCQVVYYDCVPIPNNEYLDNPSSFRVDVGPGIWHLPSWRHDLLPSNHFDLVLAIFVLPEIHPETLERTLGLFHRVLKPGGALFIRDHGLIVPSANTLDVAHLLRMLGFVLEFRPYLQERQDLRGVPRIWRKRHPNIPLPEEGVCMDDMSGWRALFEKAKGIRVRELIRDSKDLYAHILKFRPQVKPKWK